MKRQARILLALLASGLLILAWPELGLAQTGGYEGRIRPGPPGNQPDQQSDKGPRGERGDRGAGAVEDLMAFLREYEPTLAAKLEHLRQSDLGEFQEQVPTLLRLYGPVMRQMEQDPELGKLSLRVIQLRLKVQDQVKHAQAAAKEDKQSQAAARKELEATLSELFDVILKQEDLRLKSSQDRLESFSRRTRQSDQQDQDPQSGQGAKANHDPGGPPPGGPPAPGEPAGPPAPPAGPPAGGFGGPPPPGPGWGPPDRRGDQHSRERFQKRLEERQAQIERWRRNKHLVVRQRLADLLQGNEPFPWPN